MIVYRRALSPASQPLRAALSFRESLLRLMAALALLLGVMGVAHADDGFLDPAQAFRFSSNEVPGAIKLDFAIADGYYMYRERFAFTPAGQSSVQLGAPQIPGGTVKFDATFNKNVETYRNDVGITLPVVKATAPFDLIVTSQGCSDKGVCYPPIQHTVHVSGAALQGQGGGASGQTLDYAKQADGAAGSATEGAALSDQDRLYSQDYARSVLEGRSLPAILGIFFLLGVALSLLPCSLPMIPILSSIILGEGTALTRRRGFALSLAYVLGMAVVYTAFGVAAALAGQGLGAMLQNPWMLGAFGGLLLVFALSLFGCYELQLPASWQSRMSGASQRLSGGKTAAVFIMGALSALVVGACMTAPLFGVLAFIAQTGNVLLGGASLFTMALGIGVPLLIVGVGAGAVLPRAGAWMNGVKRAFGVLLAGAAVWIVAPVLPAGVSLLLWAVVLLLAAFGLQTFSATVPSGTPPDAWRWLGRALGALAALFALTLVIGAAGGSRDPVTPLAVFAGASLHASSVNATGDASTAESGLPRFAKVRTLDQLTAATTTAGKPSMLFFHADWCTSCLEMERSVFPDPTVSKAMSRFALLQADVTANNADDKALMARFKMFGPPAVIFFDAQGKELTSMQVMGYQPADRFAKTLEHAFAAADRLAASAGAAAPASILNSAMTTRQSVGTPALSGVEWQKP